MYCPACKKRVTSLTTIEDDKASRLEIADYLMRNECPWCSAPLVGEPEITFREIKSTTFVLDPPKQKPEPQKSKFLDRDANLDAMSRVSTVLCWVFGVPLCCWQACCSL